MTFFVSTLSKVDTIGSKLDRKEYQELWLFHRKELKLVDSNSFSTTMAFRISLDNFLDIVKKL